MAVSDRWWKRQVRASLMAAAVMAASHAALAQNESPPRKVPEGNAVLMQGTLDNAYEMRRVRLRPQGNPAVSQDPPRPRVLTSLPQPERMQVHIPNPEVAEKALPPAAAASVAVLDRQLAAEPEKDAAASEPLPGFQAETHGDGPVQKVVAGASPHAEDGVHRFFNALAKPLSVSVAAVASVFEGTRHLVVDVASAAPPPAASTETDPRAVALLAPASGTEPSAAPQETTPAEVTKDTAVAAAPAVVTPAPPAPPVVPDAKVEPAAPPPVAEPAPVLDQSTRKTLAAIPSNIDAPKPSQKPVEYISLEHTKPKTEAVAQGPEEKQAPGNSADGSPPAADGKPAEAAAKPKEPVINVRVDTRSSKVDAQYELEQAYLALVGGNTDAAIALYQGVLEDAPENKQALFGLAATWHRLGQLEKARPLYVRLLKLEPNHREALNNFLALAADEAPEDALQQLEALAKRNPHFSPIPAQMAYICQKLGRTDQAIENMAKAAEMAPENIVYRYNLAILFDRAGRRADAASLYKQLIDAFYRGQDVPGDVRSLQQRLTFLSSNGP